MNPCTRCHGSGREPDPLADAAEDLGNTLKIIVTDPKVRDVLHVKALTLSAAAARKVAGQEARITFLSAALRDILSRMPDPLAGDETIWRARNADVEKWRKVLEAES